MNARHFSLFFTLPASRSHLLFTETFRYLASPLQLQRTNSASLHTAIRYCCVILPEYRYPSTFTALISSAPAAAMPYPFTLQSRARVAASQKTRSHASRAIGKSTHISLMPHGRPEVRDEPARQTATPARGRQLGSFTPSHRRPFSINSAADSNFELL